MNPLQKKNKVLNESSYVKTKYKLKGVTIEADCPTEKIEIGIKLCNKYWDKIMDQAAHDMLDRIRSYGDGKDNRLADRLEKYPDYDSLKKDLKLDGAAYCNEDNAKWNPICGSFHLSIDIPKPYLDPYHVYTLYVDFDKNKNPVFDSIYDG